MGCGYVASIIIIAVFTFVLLIISILFVPKISIFNKKINAFWLVSLLGAFLMILFQKISLKEISDGLLASSDINPLKILILFFSMTFLSVFLDEVGFFKYLASLLINKCKSNQAKLFVFLYFLVAVLTIFTSNDIVILTFTPFICYFSKNAKINPIPYLVAEFAAANTWSMMLIIGNPTNIYLASSANITFIDYFKVMFVPTLISGIVQIFVLLLIFKKQLKIPLNLSESNVSISDKLSLVTGLAHLICCLILLVISSYINISMWLISLIMALSLIVFIFIENLILHKNFKDLNKTFHRLPYNLICFILSMFIIVLALNKQGVSALISELLGDKNIVFSYGFSSFLTCNLTNNIPMSVLYSTIPNMNNSLDTLKAIYSTIVGSNIGAFLTPLGALAGIMFTDLISKHDIEYSFKDFVKYGFLISIPTLFASLLSLYFILG